MLGLSRGDPAGRPYSLTKVVIDLGGETHYS